MYQGYQDTLGTDQCDGFPCLQDHKDVELCVRSVSRLRNRLARLDGAAMVERPKGVEPRYQVEDLAKTDRAEALERLRQKIARIVSQAPAPHPPPAKATRGELPFVEEPTDLGSLYIRHIPFESNHRVGRFPIHVARNANTTMLSLLALDPSLAAMDMQRALYLDTETTGLAGGTGTLPFLIGLGWFINNGPFMVEQLLLRRPGEEAPILARVSERMRACSGLVTYNGKAFDIPLVRTRFVMNRMGSMPERPHLDLVHMARRAHKERIGRCNLTSVESRVLGFGRVDDVPSGEIASRYFHFLRSGDEDALLGVVTHNVWDIVSMAALVGLYGEPLDGMEGKDLVGIAKTMQRAKNPQWAAVMADEAVARGGGAQALRTRALLAKARGDRDSALDDFERLIKEVDDDSVRLELAKLYEHHTKSFKQALQVLDRGLAEDDEAVKRRKGRLQRKLNRQRKPTKANQRAPVEQGTLPIDDPNEAISAASSPMKQRNHEIC